MVIVLELAALVLSVITLTALKMIVPSVLVAVLGAEAGADGLGVLVIALGGPVVAVSGGAGISGVQAIQAAALGRAGMAVLVGMPVVAVLMLAVLPVLAELMLTVPALVTVMVPVAAVILGEGGGGGPRQQYAETGKRRKLRCLLH